MDIRDLVRALVNYDTLAARQWYADYLRAHAPWANIGKPDGLSLSEMAIAAGVVELLCERAGETAPAWTAEVGRAPETVLLVRAAQTMPRLRTLCEKEGPEPLRRRGILAPPDFLTAA